MPTRAVPLLHAQTTESALSFLLMHHVLREVRGNDGRSRWFCATIAPLSPARKHVSCTTAHSTTKLYPTTVTWLLYQQSALRLYGVHLIICCRRGSPEQQTCVAVFADSCAKSQLCNAIGSATGTCIYPISAGSICSIATPGKLSKASSCCVVSLTVAWMTCRRNLDLAAKGSLLNM